MELDQIVVATWWMIVPLILIGSILHFVFDWSGRHRLAAVFSAVNESYWEHIKIAVWPVFLFHVVLYAAGGYGYASFIPAATVALYSIPIGMVGLIFLYKSITGRNVLWLDIGVFAVVIALAQVIFVQMLERLDADRGLVVLASLYLGALLVAFLRFTVRPPREPDVFIDPITGKYGVPEREDVSAK